MSYVKSEVEKGDFVSIDLLAKNDFIVISSYGFIDYFNNQMVCQSLNGDTYVIKENDRVRSLNDDFLKENFFALSRVINNLQNSDNDLWVLILEKLNLIDYYYSNDFKCIDSMIKLWAFNKI